MTGCISSSAAGRAYWSYQFRRGTSWSAKVSAAILSSARKTRVIVEALGSLTRSSPVMLPSGPGTTATKPGKTGRENLFTEKSAVSSRPEDRFEEAGAARRIARKTRFEDSTNFRLAGTVDLVLQMTWCSPILAFERASVRTFGCGSPPCWISQKAKSGGNVGPRCGYPAKFETSVAACGPSLKKSREPSRRVALGRSPGAHGQAVGRQVGPFTSAHVDNLNGGPHGGH